MASMTFTINDDMAKTLKALQKGSGVSTNADVLKKAVALLKLAIESVEVGGSIIIGGDDKKRRILIK